MPAGRDTLPIAMEHSSGRAAKGNRGERAAKRWDMQIIP